MLHTSHSLLDLPVGQRSRVDHVTAPVDSPQWQSWLAEIGFVDGEFVCVKRRSVLRKGVLVVQIGSSTFALSSDEAACVWVYPASLAGVDHV